MSILENERHCAEEERIVLTHRPLYQGFKRSFDFLCSLLSLIVLCPVFLIITLVILIDDPHGHPIFSQDRVGKDGKHFKMYKFRTMIKNAEQMKATLQELNEMDGPVFKVTNDPRIIRTGRFLRKTGLDELPQLYNVLKGDMSFVGPRPPLPDEVAHYNEHQKQRLLVVPGLTCIWQIMPNRNKISFTEWVEMDLEYIKKRGLLLDLKLILKTPIAMLLRHGR